MEKRTIGDVHDILCKQLEKLSAEDLSVADLQMEIDRAEEPNAKLITWRLAKRAARDFLRVSYMPSAIVSAGERDGKTSIRVYGKY